jgi:hypothetical protein
MAELGPEHLVFNTTNIVGGGVREIVTAAIAGKYDGMDPAHVGRTTAKAMRAALIEARNGNGNGNNQ